MSDVEPDAEADPVVIALAVGDPALAERLAVLLSGMSGIRLVASGEPAEATVVVPVVGGRDLDQPLTPRAAEVLALLAEG